MMLPNMILKVYPLKTQKSFFERNGGAYTRVGDVLLPNLDIGETEKKPIGKYGRMWERYLSEKHPALYSELLLTEKLYGRCFSVYKLSSNARSSR